MTDSHLVAITLTGAQLEKLLQLKPAYISKLITSQLTLLKFLQAALNTLDVSRVVRAYVFAKGIFDWSRHLIQQALAIAHCLLGYSFCRKRYCYFRNNSIPKNIYIQLVSAPFPEVSEEKEKETKCQIYVFCAV